MLGEWITDKMIGTNFGRTCRWDLLSAKPAKLARLA
jgi:hypothetical protein